MSVFDIPEQTPQHAAFEVKRRINLSNVQALRDLKQRAETSFNLFWNPPDGCTTQMVCDEYGTEAALLFELNSQIFTLICQLDPEYVPPQAGSYTINENGTVTIG